MERYQPDQYGRMMPDAHGQWVSLRAAELTALDAAQKSSADAQATVEALQKDVNTLNQLLRDKGLGQGEIDGMAADIDEIVTLRQQVEALQRERDEARDFLNTVTNDLNEQAGELSQIQALVRALPVYAADTLITVDGDLDEIDRPALRSAVMELLEYRATLDATTPAAGQMSQQEVDEVVQEVMSHPKRTKLEEEATVSEAPYNTGITDDQIRTINARAMQAVDRDAELETLRDERDRLRRAVQEAMELIHEDIVKGDKAERRLKAEAILDRALREAALTPAGGVAFMTPPAGQRWTPQERYLHDPMFKNLVDMLEAAIHRADYTPSELREAAVLAAIHYESIRVRRQFIPLTPNEATEHRGLDSLPICRYIAS